MGTARADPEGLEPSTLRLTAECSTIELRIHNERNVGETLVAVGSLS